LPWNLSEEKKKKLVKAGLLHGDDTSEIDRALHPGTRIHNGVALDDDRRATVYRPWFLS